MAFATFGHLLFLVESQVSIGLIFITHQIPNLHSVLGGHTDPLELVVEQDLVDFALSINGADGFLEVCHIPEVKDFVLTSSGQVFGIGGNGNGVNLSIMRLESVSNLEVDVPDLQAAIPAHRGEVGVENGFGLGLQLGRISHLANPILMVVSFRSVLAISKGVPELNLLISTRGDNLTVIRRERDSENFLLVSNELTDSLTGLDIPETEGLVPR